MTCGLPALSLRIPVRLFFAVFDDHAILIGELDAEILVEQIDDFHEPFIGFGDTGPPVVLRFHRSFSPLEFDFRGLDVSPLAVVQAHSQSDADGAVQKQHKPSTNQNKISKLQISSSFYSNHHRQHSILGDQNPAQFKTKNWPHRSSKFGQEINCAHYGSRKLRCVFDDVKLS